MGFGLRTTLTGVQVGGRRQRSSVLRMQSRFLGGICDASRTRDCC